MVVALRREAMSKLRLRNWDILMCVEPWKVFFFEGLSFLAMLIQMSLSQNHTGTCVVRSISWRCQTSLSYDGKKNLRWMWSYFRRNFVSGFQLVLWKTAFSTCRQVVMSREVFHLGYHLSAQCCGSRTEVHKLQCSVNYCSSSWHKRQNTSSKGHCYYSISTISRRLRSWRLSRINTRLRLIWSSDPLTRYFGQLRNQPED